MISKNFRYSEFEHSDTANKYGIDNSIQDDNAKNAIKKLVLNVLQPLRDKYGKPININSGYRCPELNKKVGGVATSQHCKGEAADCGVPNPYELAKIAKELDLPFDQMILYPGFVHFSHRANGNQRKQILYNSGYKGKRL